MDAKTLQKYNFGNLLKSLVGGNAPVGLEHEVHQELARSQVTKPTGIMVPWQALLPQRRDLVVGAPSAGGSLVATELRPQNFIDLLRPISIVGSLGATSLTGLQGNVAIPRQAGGATAHWVAESGAPAESQQVFDQVPMTPRTLAAFTDVSRKMLLQSSIDISAFVVSDLRASMGQELDRVVLCGDGTGNSPTGILNHADATVISLATNGRALTWADLVNCYVQTAHDTDGKRAFVTTKQARNKLMLTEKVAGTGNMIWDGMKLASFPGEGAIGGQPAVATQLLPSNLTKGSGTNLSSLIYGDFSEVILGTWGSGFDLILDPYTLATSGGLRITAHIDVDVCLRNVQTFAVIKDIVTS